MKKRKREGRDPRAALVCEEQSCRCASLCVGKKGSEAADHMLRVKAVRFRHWRDYSERQGAKKGNPECKTRASKD